MLLSQGYFKTDLYKKNVLPSFVEVLGCVHLLLLLLITNIQKS